MRDSREESGERESRGRWERKREELEMRDI